MADPLVVRIAHEPVGGGRVADAADRSRERALLGAGAQTVRRRAPRAVDGDQSRSLVLKPGDYAVDGCDPNRPIDETALVDGGGVEPLPPPADVDPGPARHKRNW
jgi:hypothetical protein